MKRVILSCAFAITLLRLGTLGAQTNTPPCPKEFPARVRPPLTSLQETKPAKNLILMIGDGMGPMQLKAAGDPMPRFPHQGLMSHCSLSGVTDSAAAATTFATGTKTINGALGTDQYGKDLPTILELAAKAGKSTGLLTTTEITHATPAAFAAHVASREDKTAIANDFLHRTRPDLLIGGGERAFQDYSTQEMRDLGYRRLHSWKALQNLRALKPEKVLVVLAPEHMPWILDRKSPTLRDMTEKALSLLSQNPHGFFLMVEGGRIDHAAHANDLPNVIAETKDFARAVAATLQFAKKSQQTLLVVTADHETGGLISQADARHENTFAFTTTKHTAEPVPLLGFGPYTELIQDMQDNTTVFTIFELGLYGAH